MAPERRVRGGSGMGAHAGPAAPSLDRIRAARELLRPALPETRLVPAPSLGSAGAVHLKLECELPTGSFKVRGALVALEARRRAGPSLVEVVASSTGNHGAAVAWAAARAGVRATIFVPTGANPAKTARIRELGARLVEEGEDLAAAASAAGAHARETGAYFLNDATDPALPAGPGVIGLEVLEQRPSMRTIVVPMGDTALVRGVAAAVKALRPTVRVVGVQARAAPAYYLSWREGRPVPTPTCDTLADGLATRTPAAANVTAVRALVDEVVLVSDEEMVEAMRRLALDEGVASEPAGAASTAALLAGAVPPDGETVLLVTGRNAEPALLRRLGLVGGP